MGVRGPGPDHPKRARSTVESPGCPSPVSPTVAPYSPSAHPYAVAIVASLRRRDRSSVDAAFDQQSPDGIVMETEFGRAPGGVGCPHGSALLLPAPLPACGDPARNLAIPPFHT